MKLCFSISYQSYHQLKEIEKAGYAEFRDNQYDSLEEFKNSEEFKSGLRTEEWFKIRNFCDLKDLSELIEYNLIETDGMSWHMTYAVSEFGKKILKENKVD